MSTEITRRSLLKGAVAGAALGAAGMASLGRGTTTTASAAQAVSEDEVEWDAEYDVVILGLGGAGANAAVAAYEEGATVLVCEKAPEGEEPCNTKASGQFVMATDDADGLYEYLSQLMGKFNNWDEDALRGYCDGCAENFDWMCGPMGGDPELVCPPEGSNPAENEEWVYEYGNESWSLAENPWNLGRSGYIYTWDEFPEVSGSEHCLCLTATGTRFDAGYYNLCMEAVNSRVDDEQLTVWRGCPGQRLVVDDEGAVVGVIVEKDDADYAVKANGGVVLATGGFEANADMMASFTQLPYVYLQAGTMNTGDGIKMAMGAGADLWHMSNVSGFMWAYQNPSLTTCSSLAFGWECRGIFAGPSGKRFQDETATNRHGRIDIGGRWISTPMPLPTYYIVDSAQIDEALMPNFSDGNVDELEEGLIIQADSIEELSQAIRDLGEAPDFNSEGELDTALEKYNAHCYANDGEGEEDDWGRECTIPIDTPPYYAVEVGPTMYNTQGGPRRNQYAQIINTEGYPIEGLFVGGEMGSVFADMYNGSGNLGETMVFGRLAGQNAALRAKGEFEGATEKAMTYQEKLDEEEEAAAEEESSTLDGDYADGTYEGSGTGYGGKITLSVTVEDGLIVEVEVLESSETETIGGVALPEYCEALVETQDLDSIDVVSGASNTLRGFIAAVEDALSEA